jgi:hypothetical protein
MRNLDRKGILWIVLLWLSTVGIFLYGVLAHAQTPPKPGQPDKGGMRRVAIEGTVRRVSHHACHPALPASRRERFISANCTTTDAVLATENGLVNVLIGPTKFIRRNQFFFVDGDRLRVIGFQAANQGHPTVVSEEVIKSKRALTLRDPRGRPIWIHNEISETVPGSAFNQSVREDTTWQQGVLTRKAIAADLANPEIRKGEVA